jgi:hypothetical protein
MNAAFNRQLWISLGIIFGSIIVASITIYIFSGNITSAANKIILQRTLVEQQTDALANLAKLKADAPQAERYQVAINQLLPKQYGLVGFREWLDQRSRVHSVSANFSFQGDPTLAGDTTPGSAGFTLSVQASSISTLVSFLKDLESQAPGFLLALNTFDLTNDGSNVGLNGRGALFFQ